MPFITIVVPAGVGNKRLRGIESRITNIVSVGLKVDAGKVSIVFFGNPLTDKGSKNSFAIIYCKETPERTEELKEHIALLIAKALREELQWEGVRAICLFETLSCFAEVEPYGSS